VANLSLDSSKVGRPKGVWAMKKSIGGPVKASKYSRHGQFLPALAMVAGAIGACFAAPAVAALGGSVTTPPPGATSEQSVARAATSSASGASASAVSKYTVHTTTLASGTVINEYQDAQGIVFGIAWHGPRVPDLASLLGSYFPQYQQGVKAQRAARGGRGPVSVQDAGLVVQSGGHMGAFNGNAYLPQSLPAGVSASDIQ
jgi:hypothetical protein